MTESLVRLMVDSNCDLPPEFFKANGIEVIPSNLQMHNGESLLDERLSAEYSLACLRRYDFAKDAKSYMPLPLGELVSHLQKSLPEPAPEHCFILTSTSLYAANFEAIETAAARINHRSKTRYRILSSRVLLAGQGVLALDAVELLAKETSAAVIVRRLHTMAESVYTYCLPGSLKYVRKRLNEIDGADKAKVDKPNWFAATLGDSADRSPVISFHRDQSLRSKEIYAGKSKALAAVVDQVEWLILHKKLLSKHLVLSYAGNLDDLQDEPALNRLRNFHRDGKIQLHETTMGLGGIYHMGPGSYSLGFAAMPHSL